MQENLLLSLKSFPDLRLRSINKNDIENLRNWKNENKNSFFLNSDITPEQQEKWFNAFSQREGDHMFIVEQISGGEWKEIGCMGFRRLDDEGCVDGYNIMRSHKYEPASFSMSDAFKMMLAYADSIYPLLPIRCKVLSHNPAVNWYEKNNFSIINKIDNYNLMELDKNSLTNYNPVKNEK